MSPPSPSDVTASSDRNAPTTSREGAVTPTELVPAGSSATAPAGQAASLSTVPAASPLTSPPPASKAASTCSYRREADAALAREDLEPWKKAELLEEARTHCPATLVLSCPPGVRVMQDERELECGKPIAVAPGIALELEAYAGEQHLATTVVLVPGSETTRLRIDRKGSKEAAWVMTSAPVPGYEPENLEPSTFMSYFMMLAGVANAAMGASLIVQGANAEPRTFEERTAKTKDLSFGVMGAVCGTVGAALGVYLFLEPEPPRVEPSQARGAAASPPRQVVWAAPLVGTSSWGASAGMRW